MEYYLLISGLVYLAGFLVWTKKNWPDLLIKLGFAVMTIWTAIQYVDLHYKITL